MCCVESKCYDFNDFSSADKLDFLNISTTALFQLTVMNELTLNEYVRF
jgi:hypothetical protein